MLGRVVLPDGPKRVRVPVARKDIIVSATLREYSKAERVADGVIHGLGIGSSLVAVSILLTLAVPRLDGRAGLALSVYGIAIIVLFCVSAAYHLVPALNWKPALKRCDQAAIFFKIAGTYTPLVVLIGGVFAYAVLFVVWVAALGGAFAKLALGARFERISVALYLPLGWAALLFGVAIPQLWAQSTSRPLTGPRWLVSSLVP